METTSKGCAGVWGTGSCAEEAQAMAAKRSKQVR